MYVQTEGRLHKGNHLLMGPVHDRGNAYQCIAENKTRQNLKKNLNGLLHSLQETRKSFLARSADTARYSPDQIEETDSVEPSPLLVFI